MGHGAHGQWGTWGMGHMGNVDTEGNGAHGPWAPLPNLNIFAHNIIKLDILTHLT